MTEAARVEVMAARQVLVDALRHTSRTGPRLRLIRMLEHLDAALATTAPSSPEPRGVPMPDTARAGIRRTP